MPAIIKVPAGKAAQAPAAPQKNADNDSAGPAAKRLKADTGDAAGVPQQAAAPAHPPAAADASAPAQAPDVSLAGLLGASLLFHFFPDKLCPLQSALRLRLVCQ